MGKYKEGDKITVEIFQEFSKGLYRIKGCDRIFTDNELDDINQNREPIFKIGEMVRIKSNNMINGIVIDNYYNDTDGIGVIYLYPDEKNEIIEPHVGYYSSNNLISTGYTSKAYLEIVTKDLIS